ncbi:streptomycin 6-kinase [Pseudomonas chlororaphis]|uniref:aminoglycoside phosphotransferase family protein n=1 Tax=Pseudomonas chlororaphis TaxID=587753 RepID=UPI000879B793|nr:aminoglycoside phosphotransferase family protein [Pseudomonas chlororaphis]AZD68388.1 streptomycin 3'-kinase [Pseudomonas chlororaphis subsp. aurantiaca]AZD74598.1 streptomycin 3'-kinase [Pseudomonas chlororaphis subsp. aurantiaca]QIT24278.1 phosphotransferase [Pseudomonas chlororaphis subsp. aurantiaca]WDH02393.1 aminoglycoside phosphotransferase family protein [Pseudomonas chlororaphis]WDH08759.1 aminoglycoside phosphotransferase family protein [Pseudomonas chlororaphis]
MFEFYLKRWNLQVDGEPIVTPGSHLLPVRLDDAPAMLKIALDDEEKYGNRLMVWWAGEGAARVYAHHGDALLMERAMGRRSLVQMALAGEDDEVSRIVCASLARLHAPRSTPLPPLLTLPEWFKALRLAARREGGMFLRCLTTADELLASPREQVVLHGDIHHDNVLDFEERGWLVIDPKRVMGERGFDFANLICNPDLPTSGDPRRFTRQVEVIAQAAGLERKRLLQWVLAYTGLSAAWFLEDGDITSMEHELQVAELAIQALEGAA